MVLFAVSIIGVTNGFILFGGTVICGTIVPIEQRGKLMSLLYCCAYAGTIPTVALGYMADAIGLPTTLTSFSCVAVALATFVLLVGSRAFREVVPYRGRSWSAETPPPGPRSSPREFTGFSQAPPGAR